MSDQLLETFISNPNITSWPFAAFKSNGYTLHKVTPFQFKLCWVVTKKCDSYTRGYDSVNKGIQKRRRQWNNIGGASVVLADVEKHLMKRTGPTFIAASLQDIHYPYNFTVKPNMEYHEPFMTQKELDSFHSGEFKITVENKDDYVLKLRNRVKNCMKNLDANF